MTPGRSAISGQRSAVGSEGSEAGACSSGPGARPGFTLIEVLIVITIIGILITLAQPGYNRAVLAAKEATLKENLFILRDRLDQFYADNGKYPAALTELADKRYIRKVPVDPITGSAESWSVVNATDEQGQQAGIMDIHSGSDRTAIDGTRYSDW